MKRIAIFCLCFAVIIVSALGSSVYAATLEDYPTLPYSSYEGFQYIIYEDNYRVKAFVYYPDDDDGNNHITVTANGTTLKFKSDVKGSFYRYNLIELSSGTIKWSEDGAGSVANANQTYEINTNLKSFLVSSVDIYDVDGNVVFKGPLVAPTLEEVVLEGVTTLQEKTMTTMEILTLCGVGLMALLVALVILPKVLYKFL